MSTVQIISEVNIDLDKVLDGMAQLDLSELERFAFHVNSLIARRKAPSLPKRETELLQQINRGVPVAVRQRYAVLHEKLLGETLTTEEHQEFSTLVDQIEQSDVERLKQLRQKLNGYWSNQVDIQIRAAEGWIAHADGHSEEAEGALRAAADLEDSTEKSPVTPGAILPAREMLGDFLLETNQPLKALDAYERSLKDSPNRLNGVSGAARAAQLTGDREKARAYYDQVVRLLSP